MAIKATLAALVASVIVDKKVDAEEVTEIRKVVYEDGIVERDEVDALFEINDAVSESKDNDPGWPVLFADAISDHFCADKKIDQEEAEYLSAKLMADGGVDDTERLALTKIREKATEGIWPEFDEAMKSLGV